MGHNLTVPVVFTYSERVVSHVNLGRLDTLFYYSFRWRSIRVFNSIPKHVRMISSCSVDRFKSQLDYMRSIAYLPCQPGFNNSLDRCITPL